MTRRLSPRLLDLVAADRQSRPTPRRLTASQIDTLVAIVRHAEPTPDSPEPVSACRALTVLARAARPERAVPVLVETAADRSAPQSERVTALRELGRIGDAAARAGMLDLVRDPDPRVQQAALAGLGQCGEPADDAQLALLRQPSDLAARRQLAFTRALIAHRTGRGNAFLPLVRPVDLSVGGPRSLALRRRSPVEREDDRARLRGPSYGIELAGPTYGMVCGRTRWTLVTNAELGDPIQPDRLGTRPWTAGLLYRWLPPRFSATTSYVLLSRPDRDGVRLDVVRGDGTVLYAGAGTLDSEGLRFALAEVARPGTAALQLTGKVSTRGAVSASGSSAERLRPSPVVEAIPTG